MSSLPTENETWIIETGDIVIEKKASRGLSSLTHIERLIYCVWVADYGMRNSGDLDTASDLYPDFQQEACELAKLLSLQKTLQAFSMPRSSLELGYFKFFEGICNELKNA